MNKKTKQTLVSGLAVAMGTGVVAPVVQAAPVDVNALYATAYDATIKAEKDRNQAAITAARTAINALKGTSAEWAMGTFSGRVDTVQQELFVKFMGILFDKDNKPVEKLTQAQINEAKALVIDFDKFEGNKQYTAAWSSACDKYQQANINAATAAVEKAEKSGVAVDKAEAKKLVDELLTVANNDTVKAAAEGLNKRVEAVVTALKVTEVTTLSATQIRVTFNKEVDKAEAETVAKYQIGTLTVTPKLQEDKKSVILTTTTPITGTLLYVVNPIKSATNAAEVSEIFTRVETYTDTVAPVVQKIEYPTYDKAVVTFSEPIKNQGDLTITQDGVAVDKGVLNPTLSLDGKTLTFDLADQKIVVDKPVSVVMVGTKDMGDNLITPNPVTIVLTKTKADVVKPTVVSVDALSDARISIKFSEKLKTIPVATVGGNAVNFDQSEDGITWTGSFNKVTTSVQPVVISSYMDMSSNAGDQVTVVKQFVADITNPVLNSSEVKVFNNKAYLVLNYSEDVEVGMIQSPFVGIKVKNYISTEFTTQIQAKEYNKSNGADADNAKALMVELPDSTFEAASYTITLPLGFAKDKAITPNLSAEKVVTFTKGTITINDKEAPTVNALPTVSSDNKTVTIKFSESVDYATALNVANYTVSGQSIFTNAIFTGDDKTVTLTVAPGSITYSGERLVTVSGVKDKAGNVNTLYRGIVNFSENVAPTVASAKLVDATHIEVTLSENVTSTKDGDFEVYIGGAKLVATTPVTSGTNKVTIELAAPIADLSKDIQVKLVGALVDAKGNNAVVGQIVKVQ